MYYIIKRYDTVTIEGITEAFFELNISLENIALVDIWYNRLYARFFEVKFVYLQEEKKQGLNINNALVIDPGLDYLATCVTNNAIYLHPMALH